MIDAALRPARNHDFALPAGAIAGNRTRHGGIAIAVGAKCLEREEVCVEATAADDIATGRRELTASGAREERGREEDRRADPLAELGVQGIPAHLLHEHIALDIGTEAIAEILSRDHAIPAHIAAVSRLVCDLNREESAPGLVPEASDGHPIPGNVGVDREGRLARFHRPYHSALEQWLATAQPALILSLHSFTPRLETSDAARPWQVGVLYNQDDGAARIAIPLLAAHGFNVGDNLPYSGRDLNYTMNRHAEGEGRAYLGIELRQDLVRTPAEQSRWAAILADIAQRVASVLR